MTALYSEHDPYAAQWLRHLIAGGHIAPGIVDERDMRELRPADLRGFTQVHMFAGVAVWSYALRLAGWADERPVWSGSCPCTPFSAAGKRRGHEDERHLWPAWARLIGECRPDVLFAEQVASRDGYAWLDLVCTDLEDLGYAVGALDTAACGFGAPHIRNRLYLVAHDNEQSGRQGRAIDGRRDSRGDALARPGFGGSSGARELADGNRAGCGEQRRAELLDRQRPAQRNDAHGCGAIDRLDDADGARLPLGGERAEAPGSEGARVVEAGPVNGFWADAEWLPCRDGKWRPALAGSFPLLDGAAFRVGSGSPFAGKSRAGMLRGYGNALVATQAAAFIRAYLDLDRE